MTTRTPAFRRIIHIDSDLRVSDAERSEVADLLGKHYGDGRLTQDEFNERVDRAMNARTRSDLNGLFDDLPALDEPGVPARRPRARSPHRPVLLLALIAAVLIAAGHGLWWLFMPHWLSVLLLIAVGVYVLRSMERRHRRSTGRTGDRNGPGPRL